MPTTEDVRSTIEAAARRFSDAFASGDSEAISRMYTIDGKVMPAGMDSVAGQPGIHQFWQGAMDMGIKAAELEIEEVHASGDFAYDVGRYTLKGADGNALDQGKYLVIWKWDGDHWKIHRDIWTTNLKQ